MPISLGDLARQFDCELIGDPAVVVNSVASLASAGSGDLTFLSGPAFKPHLATTSASAVILRPDDADECPAAALLSDNPYATYARMAATLHPAPQPAAGIHPSAVIEDTASVDATAHVGPNVVIGKNSSVGPGCDIGPGTVIGHDCELGSGVRLHANVTIVKKVTMGDRCIVHSGTVIGSDGFGNAMTAEGWVKVPQIGGVRIGNDVEIGANTTIDCGALGDTFLDDGVRIDNLVQIAHNVQVGAHTAIAAGVGIAGSAVIGKRCMFAGHAGTVGHISVCDDVILSGKGMITKDIDKPGVYASAFAAEPVLDWNRQVARIRRLDKLQGRVRKLEKGNK